jgi:signal transduction histidine kinase
VLCYYLTVGYYLRPEDGEAIVIPSFQELFGAPSYYPLIGFAGVGLRRLFDQQAAQERARRRAEIAATAAEERARLARDMHDSLAKTLRGIALSAAALPAWARRDPKRAAEEADRIAAAIETASREARGIITGLRDESLTWPLPEAVQRAANEWRKGSGEDIEMRCVVDPDADLAQTARYEALSILSEALTNVSRHAEATEVEVALKAGDGVVTLSVRDNGRGFAHDAGTRAGLVALAREEHYGLVGLHERAERVGGQVSVESMPGEGTTVAVQIPLEEASPSDGVQLAEVG